MRLQHLKDLENDQGKVEASHRQRLEFADNLKHEIEARAKHAQSQALTNVDFFDLGRETENPGSGQTR